MPNLHKIRKLAGDVTGAVRPGSCSIPAQQPVPRYRRICHPLEQDGPPRGHERFHPAARCDGGRANLAVQLPVAGALHGVPFSHRARTQVQGFLL